MIEIYGNLWKPETYRYADGTPTNIVPDAICITTNGFVKKNGEAVMGRGCAAEAAKRFKGLKASFGKKMRKEGNFPHIIAQAEEFDLLSFPVKPVSSMCRHDKANVVRHMQNKFNRKDIVPGWACVAELDIIARSARLIRTLVDFKEYKAVVLPRPGCGAGELNWKQVKPVLNEYLDSRYYCITFGTAL